MAAAAREVCTALQAAGIGQPLRVVSRPKVKPTNTDGWYCNVAYLRGWNCTLQVWLDRYPRYRSRKYYYGFFSAQKKDIRRIEKTSCPDMGKSLLITLHEAEEVAKVWRLCRRLSKRDFGRPLLEIYEHTQKASWNYYGLYVLDSVGLRRNRQQRLAERVVEFARTVVESLPGNEPRHVSIDDYRRLENRRAVEQHLRRERSGHLAALRKQKDEYVCQVCGFAFTKLYGDIGLDFAEAHHLVPLGSSQRVRRSTVDDLVTVCANCHRMLHRMDGEASDIPNLRRVVSAHRRGRRR